MKNTILLFCLLLLIVTQTKAQTRDTVTATYTGTIYSGYIPNYSTFNCTGGGCLSTLPVVLPPGFTIDKISYSFAYRATGECNINQGGYIISVGTCTTSCNTCNIGLPGLCILQGVTDYDSLEACLPSAKCTSDTINFVLDFYRGVENISGCTFSCFSASGQWSMTVIGTIANIPQVHIQTTAQLHGDTVCSGTNVLLTADDSLGVSPYTVKWNPGGVINNSVSVTPTSDTTFIATLTDACGDSATDTIHLIVVNCAVIELYSSDSFSLYPDPANTQLTLHSSFIYSDRAVSVSIMNVLGEIIQEEKLKWSNDINVNIKNLRAGIYFLQMKTENDSVVKKFVKE